jgi:alkanesulfonate monooxygenase SsuD/methylene tetrahydromethanopterin reductase-like flavin-dependent oxidoreductase (luciferase family)
MSYNAPVRLGVSIPHASLDGGPLTGAALMAGARAVERAGLDSLWCFDSIGRGIMLPDPLIALSVAAAVTQRYAILPACRTVP